MVGSLLLSCAIEWDCMGERFVWATILIHLYLEKKKKKASSYKGHFSDFHFLCVYIMRIVASAGMAISRTILLVPLANWSLKTKVFRCLGEVELGVWAAPSLGIGYQVRQCLYYWDVHMPSVKPSGSLLVWKVSYIAEVHVNVVVHAEEARWKAMPILDRRPMMNLVQTKWGAVNVGLHEGPARSPFPFVVVT